MYNKLFCVFLVVFSVGSFAGTITPQWAEHYIKTYQPDLLAGGDKDQVRSFFYFGRSESGVAVVGMERIRGDNYEAYRWLLLFKDKEMLGWYQDLPEFPLTMDGDFLNFPKNARYLKNLDLSKTRQLPDIFHSIGRYPFNYASPVSH